MDDEYSFCEHCLSENELLQEVVTRGIPLQGACPVCGAVGGRALFTTDEQFALIFRALVRINYSEWEYNHHLGGESLQRILFGRNVIFNLDQATASEVDFEDSFLPLEDNWYPPGENSISLGAGYWDGEIHSGLVSRLDEGLLKLLRGCFQRNYFELEADAIRLLESVRDDVENEIPVGKQYVRARIGVKSRLKEFAPAGYEAEFFYLPYSEKDIGRPPLAVATEGRLNRARVSILYLASDVLTAVSELRPHPGHLVSTAEFRTVRTLRIADFSKFEIRNFLSDSRLEELRRILSIDALLNLPVQPDRRELYVITQLLSDCILRAGYQGVAFRSSVASGINIACYSPEAFEYVDGSETVQEVESLSYKLKRRTSLPTDYDEEVYEKDDDDPLSTLFDGLSRRPRGDAR